MPIKELVRKAFQARESAYVPYSNFKVGAALLCQDKTIVLGCNIENAAYGPSICAERTAFFKAISEEKKHFSAIAIVGGPSQAKTFDFCPPCGVCRQVMREFCNPDEFNIILAKSDHEYLQLTLKELLPMSFGPDQLH